MKCVANMLFDPSNGECGYIDASRCRPGQTIHIPNVFKAFSSVSGKLKEEKPKVINHFVLYPICDHFAFRLSVMLQTGPFIAKAKGSLYLST